MLKQRFESKVRVAPGCWLWTGASGGGGYGHIRVDGEVRGAHRVSYELYIGSIPSGMHVMHRCDNPLCVNPQHLQLGTHQDNMADMYAKGRRQAAVGLRNGAAKLAPEARQAILASDLPSEKLGPMHGVSGSLVRKIRQAASAARSMNHG